MQVLGQPENQGQAGADGGACPPAEDRRRTTPAASSSRSFAGPGSTNSSVHSYRGNCKAVGII